MGMTMTQKILAKYAGLESVAAGQLIEVGLHVLVEGVHIGLEEGFQLRQGPAVRAVGGHPQRRRQRQWGEQDVFPGKTLPQQLEVPAGNLLFWILRLVALAGNIHLFDHRPADRGGEVGAVRKIPRTAAQQQRRQQCRHDFLFHTVSSFSSKIHLGISIADKGRDRQVKNLSLPV